MTGRNDEINYMAGMWVYAIANVLVELFRLLCASNLFDRGPAFPVVVSVCHALHLLACAVVVN
jgi:hypothetical protein